MRESIKSLLRPFYRRVGGPRLRAAATVLLDPDAPPRLDPNLLLHNQRGALLREMPRPVATLLSAGCAGRWYFDWIEQRYGRVPRHVGIEYYAPRPDDLPANVEWIANTCSDMSGVADASCDLVFSGQNVEHLWPEEVVGFLVEAARVTREGGWLVIDSPNRLVTAPLNWSHPEHTVELAVDEIAELVTLAGFTVRKRAGLWLCRDPATGAVLPFDPNEPAGDWSVPERILAAGPRPAESFLWWVEAQRNGAAPDAAALHARIAAIFAAAWPERVQRLVVPRGLAVTKSDGADWIEVPAGHGGMVMFGPYMPLRAGDYRATFTLAAPGEANFDVVAEDGATLLASGATGGAATATLAFSLERLHFGVQFRCTGGRGPFRLRRGIALDEPPRG